MTYEEAKKICLELGADNWAANEIANTQEHREDIIQLLTAIYNKAIEDCKKAIMKRAGETNKTHSFLSDHLIDLESIKK